MMFLLLLVHLTADFWLQSTWMATRKHQSWVAAVIHGGVYAIAFLPITRDPLALFILFTTHTLIDHHRLATVIPRIVNWSWQDWRWRGWSNPKSYDPNDQPSYFPPQLNWLNIVADQIMHLWILYFLFR